MGLIIDYVDGQTPLSEEELEGLLIPTISTRQELDEFEQKNIEEAVQWIMSKSFNVEKILTEKFILFLHKRMFSDVWKWAGKIRKSNKNLGTDWWKISIELEQLLGDMKFWIENKVYANDEIAIRFKHRIVSIHCFANVNGRHSRLIADIIIEKVFKKKVFSWGNANLVEPNINRENYLQAINKADNLDYSELLLFARS